MSDFKLHSPYPPKGDQEKAIEDLAHSVVTGNRQQTLLGVTGSGKTFTMANVIEKVGKPALIISHNKTLAAQLCTEFREFFPNNPVEYFVSYYDYYQPEAYLPASDTYIEKDSSINNDIDRLRHAATQAVLERDDVIVVASVSCIYGLGSPEDYQDSVLWLSEGIETDLESILEKLVNMQFNRTTIPPERGQFRLRGEILEIHPVDKERIIRADFFGDEIEQLSVYHPVTGEILSNPKKIFVYPAKHFITPGPKIAKAIRAIEDELRERIQYFRERNMLLEAQRIEMKTNYDLELLQELGYCNGIENYSRHLTGRAPGQPPATLIDYFPDNFLVFLDESHVTIPQLHGMQHGDRGRKKNLIDHGFRLPSAYDNRPLAFEEFMQKVPQLVYVSATPGKYETKESPVIIEQIIRPTGLVDPEIIIRPVTHQVDDLIGEVKKRAAKNERVLVTTLTKKMAEDLADYLAQVNISTRYLHSSIDTLERIEILRDLRLGKFDCLVGVNLLREGLDLPEVSLVAVLDADKEGFLRSETSLVQTMGRAARNVSGTVILYADNITGSIERAVRETERRRGIQLAYNKEHGIIPKTIRKAVRDILEGLTLGETADVLKVERKEELSVSAIERLVKDIEKTMKEAAKRMEFETAAALRDEMFELRREIKKRIESTPVGLIEED
ncbi:MAG: excinuclease ABC subunit UvrB [Candidatus Eremiobacteraeota bacterium]|nr:excinuclease ABC subunit UvrB [Candidatus Eremiobacteraeota bacterium]